MSTQISKRALSAGLGVGALALLAQTQRASADTSFTSFSFPATGGSTPRTMPDRLAEIKNVKDFGAVGNGTADDTAAIQAALDAAYGTYSSPNGGPGANKNCPVYFPNGGYKITSPLKLRSVRGAHIFGAGRFATSIVNVAGGSVFVTNGCEYSKFERLTLATSAGTGACCFDLDWDYTGTTALQSNTFQDMFFGTSDFGVRIGATGYMGSETHFLNCFFSSCGTGLYTANGNALDNTVTGGDFQSCKYGIHVGGGSVNLISGVSFQNGPTNAFDIAIDYSAGDSSIVTGCRTESANFISSNAPWNTVVTGCYQPAAAPGIFAYFVNAICITGCLSQNGQLRSGGSATLYGSANKFFRSDWNATGANVGNAMTTGFLIDRLTVNSDGNLTNATFSTLPPASAKLEGALVPVTDSSTAAWGAKITGGGTNHVLAYCNGTDWIVK